jgi:hypothetical protein
MTWGMFHSRAIQNPQISGQILAYLYHLWMVILEIKVLEILAYLYHTDSDNNVVVLYNF